VSRLAPLLTVATALATVLAACSPEIVIACSEATNGSGGGVAGGGAAGSAGTGVSGGGTGAMSPLGDAGAGGQGGADTTEPVRLLADSVADFSSTTQGEHGWTYGYDGGSLDSFTQMTRTATIINYKPVSMDVWDCWAGDLPYWTQLFSLGGHPNGTDTGRPSKPLLQRAVRRWTSNYAGDIMISGEAAKIDLVGSGVDGSNGVDVSVYVDLAPVYTTFIPGDDGAGTSYRVPATVQFGSFVDFVIDPHESNDHHDLTRFTGVIVAQPPP
jgi:hypothetical protein